MSPTASGKDETEFLFSLDDAAAATVAAALTFVRRGEGEGVGGVEDRELAEGGVADRGNVVGGVAAREAIL